MYGMEKKPGQVAVFDLEKDIKGKPGHAKKILEKAEKRITEVKKLLREGASEKDFDRLGVLLNGYASLQKVLKKAAK